MQSLTKTLSLAVLLSTAIITASAEAQQAGGRNGGLGLGGDVPSAVAELSASESAHLSAAREV